MDVLVPGQGPGRQRPRCRQVGRERPQRGARIIVRQQIPDIARRLALALAGVHCEQGDFLCQLAKRRPILRRPVEVIGHRQLLSHPRPDRLAEFGAVQEGADGVLERDQARDAAGQDGDDVRGEQKQCPQAPAGDPD